MLKDQIKALRSSKGLTQEELAEKLGLAKSTISMYENGNRIPDFVTLEAIADFFNVNLDTLRGSAKGQTSCKGVLIPVLGNVQAGIPIQAMQEILDYEEISEQMARQGEYFGLRIKGDSMEHYILEGDVVIVRQQSDVDSGKIAVVLVNGTDATVKRINKEENGIYLVANNPAYMPKFYTKEQIEELPVQIIGEVVEIRRKTS